jgi:hypothetical protein
MNLIVAKHNAAALRFRKFMNLNGAEWDIVGVGNPVTRKYNRILVLLTYEETKEYNQYIKVVLMTKVVDPQEDILYV